MQKISSMVKLFHNLYNNEPFLISEMIIDNKYTLYLCRSPNPQVNTAISVSFSDIKNTDGLLVHEYCSKSAIVKKLSSSKKFE